MDAENSVWKQLLAKLEEQQQYGFLDKARYVREAFEEGGALKLVVSDDDAREYFESDLTKLRIMVASRSFSPINDVRVYYEPPFRR